jgi:hypothetical protein
LENETTYLRTVMGIQVMHLRARNSEERSDEWKVVGYVGR